MKRNRLNFFIDALMLASMLIAIFTGLLLAFAIGKGHATPDAAKYFWGLHRHEWGDIHTIFTISMSFLMVLHLVLHLDFYRNGFRTYFGFNGVVAVLVTFLITAAILALSIEIVPKGNYDHHTNRHGNHPQHRGKPLPLN